MLTKSLNNQILQRIHCWVSSLLTIGTPTVIDEALLLNIRMTNVISVILIFLIGTVGTVIVFLTRDPAIAYPAALEFVIACSVLHINDQKQPVMASWTLFTSQCVAIIYFSYIMGDALQLVSMVIFLISIIYLLFKDTGMRRFCLFMAFATYCALEYIYYSQHVTPYPHNPALITQFMIRMMANLGVILLMILVSVPYVSSNDLKIKLEKANRFIRIFIYETIHELHNAIAPLWNIYELLKIEAERNPDNENLQKVVKLLGSSCNNMVGIVENLLDVSRIEAGKGIDLKEKTFRFSDHFEGVIETLKISADYYGKKLTSKYEAGIPPILIADPVKLSQILNNLVLNAFKYGAKGSLVRVLFTCTDVMLVITVRNEGKGIPKELQHTIFELYISGDNANVRSNGVGLYTVKKIVTAMQGSITLQSDSHYTQFTVEVPIKIGKEKDLPKISEVADIPGKHVLLVDDNAINIQVLQIILRQIGYIISVAYDGEEALESVRDDQPDLIVLDNSMPGLSGEEVLRTLKADPKYKAIPVIMSVGYAEDKSEYFLSLGASGFVNKSGSTTTLRNLIYQQLQQGHTTNTEIA